MVPLHLFNGLLTDSNKVESLDILRYAYADLATAKIITTLPTMQPLSAFNTILDTARNQGNSTVAVLFGQYASLKPTALSQNLFSVSNQQFYDVAGRSQSSYFQNNLFAAAATEKYFKDTVNLKWSTALYYSNTSASLLSVSIDFKDGSGYQLITSTGVQKVYTDSTGSKPVVYKAVFSNGLTLYCNSSLTVKVTTGFSARYVDTDPYTVTININSLPGATAYNDFQDKLQIRYSVNNPTRTNSNPALRKLRKPIIYVEGYDVSGKSGYYVLGQLQGADLGYNLIDLIKADNNNQLNNGEWVKLANLPGNSYDFMHDLDDIAGYDLVFVNYNTMRSIPDNALMLQQVINWANSQKASIGSTQKNVVIGVSMGGVVARYCLANMTRNIGFNSTDTKILITHDSPHQGANVPLGFQYFLYNLAYTKVLDNYVKDKNEDIREFLALNDKISTQQLLKARAIVTPGDNIAVSMNSFLNGPNNPYHQMVNLSESQRPYKFVATAQGSQCGINVFEGSNITLASQDELFTAARIYYPWIGKKYWLNTNIKSLPSTGVSVILDYKMEARISIFGIGFGWRSVRDKHPENPANFVNWDGTPGGTQSIKARTGGALSEGLQNVGPWYLATNLSIKAGLSLNIAKDQFTFVHISSALDAPENTPLTTIFNYAVSGNANTRVDKFVSQEFYQNTNNIFHTDYTPRNARWMFNEMENISQPPINCNDICSNIAISGPAEICNTGAYSVPGLPSYATLTWSSSDNTIATVDNTGTVNKVANGYITLTAAINFNGGLSCNIPSTLTKAIKVGIELSNITVSYSRNNSVSQYIDFGSSNNASIYTQTGNFRVNAFSSLPGVNNYTWVVNGGYGYSNFNATGASATFTLTGTNAPTIALSVTLTNTLNGCGSSITKNVVFVGSIPGGRIAGFDVSPNPANTTITITASSNKKELKANEEEESLPSIKEIRLIDKMGNIKLTKRYADDLTKSDRINIAHLPNDIYTLMIFNGTDWEAHKIVKQ